VLLERIESNTVSGIAGRESMRLPLAFLSCDRPHAPRARDALRNNPESAEIFDEASDGAHFWAGELLCLAEFEKQRMNLFLPEVRVVVSQTLDLFDDRGVPETLASYLRRARAGIEALQLSPSVFELLFPLKERPTLHLVGINGCC